MNIRFIVAFSFLILLFSGSVGAIFDLDQAKAAIEAMKAGFVTDEELENMYDVENIRFCRSILTLRDDILKMGDDRGRKIELIKQFLKKSVHRESAMVLMKTARLGTSLIKEASVLLQNDEDEQLKKLTDVEVPVFYIDVPQPMRCESAAVKVYYPIVDARKNETKQSLLRSRTRYIVPAVVICSGAIFCGAHYILKKYKKTRWIR